MNASSKKERLTRRHRSIRARVRGTDARPRLSVSRSNMHIHAQIINDESGKTIIGLSDSILKKKGTKQERAGFLGEEIARKAKEKGITKVIFDRGGYRYHGRVRALADAARKAGLEF